MRIKRLVLKNFRNISNAVLTPDPALNFLVGLNGQGKTSLIEAIAFLSSLRSFRDAKPPQVIRWNSNTSEIIGVVSSENQFTDEWQTEIKIRFQWIDTIHQKATKTAFINEKPYRNSTQFLSKKFGNYEMGFHAIVFNPADHDLVRGEPSIRRSYLDQVLASENLEYLRTLQRYRKILEQRNAILKTFNQKQSSGLHEYTQSLCQYSAYLAYQRLSWILRSVEPIRQILDQIAPMQVDLRLAYFSNWVPNLENLCYKNSNLKTIHFSGQGELPSLELLEKACWTQVTTLETAEKIVGYSLVGAHRDDWRFLLSGKDLKSFGSQGEIRSALLSLKLVEINLFRETTGHRPVFLLDDFSSELDRERRGFLLKYLRETDLQTFVTTTEDSLYTGRRFWVKNGTIEEGIHDNRTKAIGAERNQ